jgi:N-acetylmuramate 1-kinase
LPVPSDFSDFFRDVEWMGLQRHLKVLGIFARIRHRDGKSGYVEDTPRLIAYVRPVAERYRELQPLARLIDRLEQKSPIAGYAF